MCLRTTKLNHVVVFQVMTPLVSLLTNFIIRAGVFQNAVVAGYITVQVEAARSPKTLVPSYQAAWFCKPEDHNVQLQRQASHGPTRNKWKLLWINFKNSLCLSSMKPWKRKRVGVLDWPIFNVGTWTWVISLLIFYFRQHNYVIKTCYSDMFRLIKSCSG